MLQQPAIYKQILPIFFFLLADEATTVSQSWIAQRTLMHNQRP